MGLITCTGVEADVLEWDVTDEKWQKYRGYGREPDPEMFREGLDEYLIKLKVRSDAGIGDIIWMRAPGTPRHVGIVTRLRPYKCMVHACIHKGKVVQERITNPGSIKSAWRYPGLQRIIDECSTR